MSVAPSCSSPLCIALNVAHAETAVLASSLLFPHRSCSASRGKTGCSENVTRNSAAGTGCLDHTSGASLDLTRLSLPIGLGPLHAAAFHSAPPPHSDISDNIDRDNHFRCGYHEEGGIVLLHAVLCPIITAVSITVCCRLTERACRSPAKPVNG
jgi:hypothetical protein